MVSPGITDDKCIASRMSDARARFAVGQPVRHRLFHYRGVIVDVDASFQGTEQWYLRVARSRPPKDRPWYRVLVHDAEHETYVAERNLEPDASAKPIRHPQLARVFADFSDGRYIPRHKAN